MRATFNLKILLHTRVQKSLFKGCFRPQPGLSHCLIPLVNSVNSVNHINSINHVNSVNSVNHVNSVSSVYSINSVISVNSFSAMLPPSDGIFAFVVLSILWVGILWAILTQNAGI